MPSRVSFPNLYRGLWDPCAAFKNSNDLKQVLKRVESFNKKQEDGEEVGHLISVSLRNSISHAAP